MPTNAGSWPANTTTARFRSPDGDPTLKRSCNVHGRVGQQQRRILGDHLLAQPNSSPWPRYRNVSWSCWVGPKLTVDVQHRSDLTPWHSAVRCWETYPTAKLLSPTMATGKGPLWRRIEMLRLCKHSNTIIRPVGDLIDGGRCQAAGTPTFDRRSPAGLNGQTYDGEDAPQQNGQEHEVRWAGPVDDRNAHRGGRDGHAHDQQITGPAGQHSLTVIRQPGRPRHP